MGAIASHISSLTIVYSIVCSDANQRKHQSSASLAFVKGIHRGPVNSPHKWPVTRKMFPFDDVIMVSLFSFISYRASDLQRNFHVKFHFSQQAFPNQGGGGVLLSRLSPFRYFPNVSEYSNTGYLYDITFTFDRCHRS